MARSLAVIKLDFPCDIGSLLLQTIILPEMHIRDDSMRRRRLKRKRRKEMGAKKALLVGCNYPGTKAELKGCVNDVKRMRGCLVERFGFAEEDIAVLIDTDEAYLRPTGANIRRAMTDLVSPAEPGDVLFFHYSGHGARLPADYDEDDDTGYDECIVPCDMNLINDEDFRALVDKVPIGCRITIVSDSCHSGGLIEHAKEQIGNSTDGRYEDYPEEAEIFKNRSLPLSTLIDILMEKTGKKVIDARELRPALFDIFGENSSSMAKGKGGWGFMDFLCSLVHWFLTQEKDSSSQEGHEAETRRSPSDSGVLISGCQTHQTSADVNPDGEPNESYGALSDAIQTILKKSKGNVSNRELVTKARKMMVKQGFKQQPGLYCSDELADAPFIC